jgi:hypothetical protein
MAAQVLLVAVLQFQISADAPHGMVGLFASHTFKQMIWKKRQSK